MSNPLDNMPTWKDLYNFEQLAIQTLEERKCVGCGFCCSSQPCCMAFMGGWWRDGICDLLFWNGERYRCRFIEFCEAAGLPQVSGGTLGAGRGCNGEDGQAPWRVNVRQRTQAEAYEIRAVAKYEDESALVCLESYSFGDENLKQAIKTLVIETNRLFGHSIVTLLEAEEMINNAIEMTDEGARCRKWLDS